MPSLWNLSASILRICSSALQSLVSFFLKKARDPDGRPDRVLMVTKHCVVAYDVFPKVQACIGTCAQTYLCACLHMSRHTSIRTSMRMSTHVSPHIHPYVYAHVYACLATHPSVCLCAFLRMSRHSSIRMSMHMSLRMSVPIFGAPGSDSVAHHATQTCRLACEASFLFRWVTEN